MAQHGRWPARLALLLSALPLFSAAGCMSFLHPIQVPPAEQRNHGDVLPRTCRNHVHIWIVHGMDPLDYANLTGLREYLISIGYIKTSLGQLYHTPSFVKEVKRVREEDPEGRLVLIGFSFGANMARNLANAAKEEQIPIDLLVYFGGNTLDNVPRDRPDNVIQLVNVLAKGCIWNGTKFDDAINKDLDDTYHFGSPTHPYSLEMLSRELAVVAARVPVYERVMPPPVGEEAPTPRPVRSRPKEIGTRDEWDFLRLENAESPRQSDRKPIMLSGIPLVNPETAPQPVRHEVSKPAQ